MKPLPDRPVVYLLPGLLCDATVWAPQVRALEPDYEVRIPDFFGLDSIEAMARVVLQDAPARFCVAGHSMGGRVALEVFRLAPDRVERLGLMDTGVHGVRSHEAGTRQILIDLAYKDGMQAVADSWLPPMVHPKRVGDAALMDPLRAMILSASPEIFEGQQKALLGRRDATPLLAQIACPTLVLCGRQDGWSPFSHHVEIAAGIAGSVLVPVEDSGHMVTVERPEAVNAALCDWLARDLATSAAAV